MRKIALSISILFCVSIFSEGLKTSDYSGNTIDSNASLGDLEQKLGDSSMTPEQLEELKKSLADLKKNQAERAKFLKELENDL